MRKLTFTLKQHTPLIHFQLEKDASFRATELKPKLDKYLYQNAGVKDSWKLKGQEAIDYKVRIDSKGVELTEITGSDKVPMFFGNMGGEYEKHPKYLSFTHEPILITFFSFNAEVLNAIKQHFGAFLMTVNFGTRQSKGFGNYLLKDQPHEALDQYFDLTFQLSIEPNASLDNLFFRGNGHNKSDQLKGWIRLMGQVDIFYKSLRSGINRKDGQKGTVFYIKPAIFHYAKDVLKVQWDKKSIKERYVSQELRKQLNNHPNSDVLHFESGTTNGHHVLLKDIFGLSSEESWRSYSAKVSKENRQIKRFRSPLLFKPVQVSRNRYLIGVKHFDVDPAFLNQDFRIKFGHQTGLTLRTPGQFSWPDFFKYLKTQMPDVNQRSRSDQKVAAQPEYQVLKAIYDQL
ncbi:MAG: hypothetical protein AAFX87_29065 [Bacteroidota bacterium]